jgi:hypothetical protein
MGKLVNFLRTYTSFSHEQKSRLCVPNSCILFLDKKLVFYIEIRVCCETTTAIPHMKEMSNLNGHCCGDIKSHIVICIG